MIWILNSKTTTVETNNNNKELTTWRRFKARNAYKESLITVDEDDLVEANATGSDHAEEEVSLQNVIADE